MERNKLYYTNIEEKVRDYLDDKDKEYEFQFPTRTGFVIDFVLVDKKIAIEVDGIHWHSSDKAKKHDKFKDYMLKREGWKVIRIEEEEIDNLDSLLSSI